MKVLVVDDEPSILETIERRLRRDGYTVFSAESAEEASSLFKRVSPDLIVLDIMLPNRSGLEFCQWLRKDSDVPVIFLSAKAAEEDKVRGLDLGGDDYISKPFSLAELSARVKTVLRRSSSASGGQKIVESGNLRVDPIKHVASLDDQAIDLARREFALLNFFMENTGQVFSRDTLLDRIWGQDAYVSPRTVDVHVRWLREKIEEDPSNPLRIVTVRGVGYKFEG